MCTSPTTDPGVKVHRPDVGRSRQLVVASQLAEAEGGEECLVAEDILLPLELVRTQLRLLLLRHTAHPHTGLSILAHGKRPKATRAKEESVSHLLLLIFLHVVCGAGGGVVPRLARSKGLAQRVHVRNHVAIHALRNRRRRRCLLAARLRLLGSGRVAAVRADAAASAGDVDLDDMAVLHQAVHHRLHSVREVGRADLPDALHDVAEPLLAAALALRPFAFQNLLERAARPHHA